MTDATEDAHDQTDLELIARWQAGDERAATALVSRHAEAVGRFAASVGARGDVQEVVQDTFVRAFASLESFRGESSLRTWLFTIARRLLLDRRRSERRHGEQVEVQEQDVITDYSALDTVVAEETRAR
ncbi:MAG: sigma-70 family RNA polymerase sigma factor, partial [Gemmatimonadaceae bacterium]|nr:sigma-70 family RNA polymerase sigma factor [Gemmatimonadaceae bacterium]